MAERQFNTRGRNTRETRDEEVEVIDDEPVTDNGNRNKKRNIKKTKASKQDVMNHKLLQDCGIDTSDMSKQEITELAQVLLLSRSDMSMTGTSTCVSDNTSEREQRAPGCWTESQSAKTHEKSGARKPGTIGDSSVFRHSPDVLQYNQGRVCHTPDKISRDVDSDDDDETQDNIPDIICQTSDMLSQSSSTTSCIPDKPSHVHTPQTADHGHNMTSHTPEEEGEEELMEVYDRETQIDDSPKHRNMESDEETQVSPQHSIPESDKETQGSPQHSIPESDKETQGSPQHSTPESDKETQGSPQHSIPESDKETQGSPQHSIPELDKETQGSPQHSIPESDKETQGSPQHSTPESDKETQGSPQLSIPELDEETQIIDVDTPSVVTISDEVADQGGERKESSENGCSDKASVSDEETQYVISEPTLRDDVLLDEQPAPKKRRNLTTNSNSATTTKKLTQRKMEQFSHVIIPESPPPRSPPPRSPSPRSPLPQMSQTSQESSPIKPRKSVKRPIEESDDEETQDYNLHLDRDSASLNNGVHQATKKTRLESPDGESIVDIQDGEGITMETPAPQQSIGRLKSSKVILRHPVQFMLSTSSKDKCEQPLSPVKPLCRRYRKVRRKVVKELFAPTLESVNTYTKVILQYFQLYHQKVTQLQTQSKCMLEWGESVKVGKHWDKTLDAKRRGQPDFEFENSEGEEDIFQIEKEVKGENAGKGLKFTKSKALRMEVQNDESQKENSVPKRKTRNSRMTETRAKQDMVPVIKRNVPTTVSGNLERTCTKTLKDVVELSDEEDNLLKTSDSKSVNSEPDFVSTDVLYTNQNRNKIGTGKKRKLYSEQFDLFTTNATKDAKLMKQRASKIEKLKDTQEQDGSRLTRESKVTVQKGKTEVFLDDSDFEISDQVTTKDSKKSSAVQDSNHKTRMEASSGKTRLTLQRHRSDLSTNSTESFKSEELDLDHILPDNVSDRPKNDITEESLDGLSQSSAALLNSQGDVYSTQYCVRKERASVVRIKPFIDDNTLYGANLSGKLSKKSGNEDISPDDTNTFTRYNDEEEDAARHSGAVLGAGAEFGMVSGAGAESGADSGAEKNVTGKQTPKQVKTNPVCIEDSGSEEDEELLKKPFSRSKFRNERRFPWSQSRDPQVDEAHSSSDNSDKYSEEKPTAGCSEVKQENAGRSRCKSVKGDSQTKWKGPQAGPSKLDDSDVEIQTASSDNDNVRNNGHRERRQRGQTYTKKQLLKKKLKRWYPVPCVSTNSLCQR